MTGFELLPDLRPLIHKEVFDQIPIGSFSYLIANAGKYLTILRISKYEKVLRVEWCDSTGRIVSQHEWIRA